jgi:hypothetical protein
MGCPLNSTELMILGKYPYVISKSRARLPLQLEPISELIWHRRGLSEVSGETALAERPYLLELW